MKKHNARPGASFAFKPSNTVSSSQEPDFSKSPKKTKKVVAGALSNDSPPPQLVLRDLGTMVNERAPPKVPSSATNAPREKSPDSDSDIDALLRGFSSIKASAREGFQDPFHPTTGAQSSQHRHPQMVSSRKQKAGHSNLFNHQRTRPEHHLDASARISAPIGPTYQDRKPPPLPTFDTNFYTAPTAFSGGGGGGGGNSHGDQVFYTDPSKASADLKDLLEGGFDESSEEEDEVETKSDEKVEGQVASPKKVKESKSDMKDGTVEGLKVKLLPHQVDGVEWMRGRELGPVKRGKVPKGGLLADDMGLGKTLQTISLILRNQRPGKDDKRWKRHYEKVEKTTLVVAPLALIKQWEAEITEKIAKSHRLKVCIHHGTSRTKNFKEFAQYDIVITTYGILSSEHKATSPAENGVKAGCFGLHWWRVVLDEAHTIKNRNAKASKAACDLRSEYRWCLSGTPMQNNLDELQALVKFLRIAPYDDLKQWREHFDAPMKNGKGHIAIKRLHTLLQCFMKRRRKEILKEAGALNPGGKPTAEGETSSTGFKVTERKVIAVEANFSSAERRFYDKLAQRTDKSIENMMKGRINYTSALTLLLRMRQVCDHPKLVEGKLDNDKDAMSTDASQKAPAQTADVDDMADLFAGMGFQTKACSICGYDMNKVDQEMGRDHCKECEDDLAYFNDEGTTEKKAKKSKVKKIKKQKVVKKARRPRNRNAVVDSDDEGEDEGSWLVPEGQRGHTKLGKAGGSDDENAEGGGDSLGSEDSEDDEDEQSRSTLDSFIVDDEPVKKEKGYVSLGDDDADSDDTLPSIDALAKQMASQTLDEKPKSRPSAASTAASATDSEDDDDSSQASETDNSDESDSEEASYLSNNWDNAGSSGSKVLPSAKIREMIKILQNEVKEHKFIVFSQFTSMLNIAEPFLRKEKLKFVRYDGSMKNDEREESLRRLRGDKSVRILLCSLKCGSLGLNLTAATRVIILEPFWNPFVEEQAIDRVHRLTQTIDVIVYKLTVKDTIETQILALQEKKRLLAEEAIEGGARKGALKLGLADIIALFRPGQVDDNADFSDKAQVMRDQINLVRPRKGERSGLSSMRQESEIYGRRW